MSIWKPSNTLSCPSYLIWLYYFFYIIPRGTWCSVIICFFSLSSVTWCLAMQTGSWTSGTGRPPSCTTELKHMTKCASALSGTHTRPLRSSPAAGTDRSSCGTKMKRMTMETTGEVAEIDFIFFFIFGQLFCSDDLVLRFILIPALWLWYWLSLRVCMNFMDWYPAPISSLLFFGFFYHFLPFQRLLRRLRLAAEIFMRLLFVWTVLPCKATLLT